MRFLYILIILFFLLGCETDEQKVISEDSMITITSSTSDDGFFNVELLAADTLFVGYNKIYLNIINLNDDVQISEGNITLMPLMHMVSKKHAAPTEDPATMTNEHGYFEGAIVFLMPDNPDEYWELKVAIATGELNDTVVLNIPRVKIPDEPRKLNVISDIDEKVYFISLVEPSAPEVGINDIEFAIHFRENMMSFPAAQDITISFEPEMPSMEHGSPNNEQPEHIGEGHYSGKINFTMTGWWRVHIGLKSENQVISDDDYFDITF